ncbi:MAG: hypothetical protein ACOZJZ_12690 [Pseudomonadota bacterium]
MRALSPEEAAEIDTPHLVWGVDSEGHPLGLVPRERAFAVVARQVGPGLRLDHGTGEWVREAAALDDAKAQAHAQIDQAAGAARLRYITEVPGQQAVYLRKEEQAREFKAAGYPAEAVPPYVAAEVNAMPEGTTPQQAADTIIAIADQWQLTLSPLIEQERLKGKRAVTAATTLAAVQAAALAATEILAAV